MRHRAAELGPVFDAAGYGGGFDLEAGESFPGGFEPIAEPAPQPQPSRRGRPVAVAGAAAVALVGAALLVAGASQMVQRDALSGLATPLPGPNVVAMHQAGNPAGAAAAHQPPAPPHRAGTSTKSPTSTAPPATTKPVQHAQGTQLPNTIRLPRGGTAYLVHVQVADDGSLPIPSGVDQAVWWGTGLDAKAGATVFAGHVNWAGVTGPFAELWNDQIGNVITVRDNSGAQLHYRVTQVLTLNKSTLPKQAPTLFSATGPQRIVVATCGGEWVGGTLGYADNRVMVAVPVT
ncbi:MAG TPA: class F sortase [Pseudonocardiaceae bacterium]|nr:class F sortase [Pseudonocardiaceae bacterium]